MRSSVGFVLCFLLLFFRNFIKGVSILDELDCLCTGERQSPGPSIELANASSLWKRVPLIEGKPAVLNIVDNAIYGLIRTAAQECWLEAKYPPWEEERGQMSQGGAIDLWFHQAVKHYPYQTNDIDKADVVIHHLPLTLLYQMMTYPLWKSSCPRLSQVFQRYLKTSIHPHGFEPYATILQHQSGISAQNPHRLTRLNHSMWIGAYFATKPLSQKFSAQLLDLGVNRFVGMGFSNYGWPQWTSIPSTSNHAIEKLIEACPCLIDQEKSIPFFFSGSERKRIGGQVRQALRELDWKTLFPGSVITITPNRFVQLKSSAEVKILAEQYAKEITAAKFCLIVQGDTPDVRRLFEAIIVGCVPVLMTEWEERLPFNWLLEGRFYEKFTLRIPLTLILHSNRGVQDALKQIWNISPEQYQNLRSNMKTFAAELIWGFGSPLDLDGRRFGLAAVNAFVESTLRIYSHCPREKIQIHEEREGQLSEKCTS